MAEKEFKLLGFNFYKFQIERNPTFEGKIPNIESNIDIKSIEKHKFDLIKEEPLKIDFLFNLKYKELGKLEMSGSLIIMFDEKTQKQVLEEWKDKKLPNNIRLIILNIILQKSSLKALQLEEEIGLPLHVNMPRLSLEDPNAGLKQQS